MKKIQCEVCGSTEIKKVGDDLFECQSCGVQYSKNDVSKLLVKITGEVKLTIRTILKILQQELNDSMKTETRTER